MLKKILQPKYIIALLLFLLLVGGGVFYWLNLSYGPAEEAFSYLESSPEVEVYEAEDYFSFWPARQNEEVEKPGFVFYPGAQIKAGSYAALASELASRGYPVFLVEMPYQLAILGWRKAEDIAATYQEITDWYLLGHSLGGAMATRFLAREQPENFTGLILLGAYPAGDDDIAASDYKVLSIYGSEDKVMDQELFKERQENLPAGTQYHEISGGNHAQFGQYGEQQGDGEAQISFATQLEKTRELILEFLP